MAIICSYYNYKQKIDHKLSKLQLSVSMLTSDNRNCSDGCSTMSNKSQFRTRLDGSESKERM